MKRFLFASTFIIFAALAINAQPLEQRPTLSELATAADSQGVPALEARLLTTMLNGADDSPVTNVKLVIRNVSTNFYTYVTGWATFYDSAGIRCGGGLFKIDALAVNESASTDTPGLRLRCSPATWRIVATNLLTNTSDVAKPTESALPVAPAVEEKPATMNFVISIDEQEYPIQINNPLVLRLGNRNRKVVLKMP